MTLRVSFAPEGYEVTPETDELFVHALDKSCKGLFAKGCYPRFLSSASELTPESRKELDKTATGFAAV